METHVFDMDKESATMKPLTKRFIEYGLNFSKDNLIPKQSNLDFRELAEFAANFMTYESISETHIHIRMLVVKWSAGMGTKLPVIIIWIVFPQEIMGCLCIH